MAVVRVNKTKDYTVMSNTHLRDSGISLAAKGLLSVALSLPDNWENSIEGLCKYCNCGKDKMRTIMKELKDGGYLRIFKTNSESGTFDYEYIFYEKKQPDTEKPHLVEPHLVEPDMVNPPQLNTKEQNTKEQNTNTPITPKEKAKKSKTSKVLTQDVINEEICNRHFSPEIMNELYEWLDYKNEIKDPYASVTSFKKMLTILENAIAKHGEKAVIERMDEAMSRQWIGWNFGTMDAFDKNRPYMQNKQQLDKKPRYKQFEPRRDADGDRTIFQELRKNLEAMK